MYELINGGQGIIQYLRSSKGNYIVMDLPTELWYHLLDYLVDDINIPGHRKYDQYKILQSTGCTSLPLTRKIAGWGLQSDIRDPEEMQNLIQTGVDVHARDDQALRWASEKGHTEIVKILLQAGADVHAIGN